MTPHHGQAGRQAGRQTDRQVHRQMQTNIDRQIDEWAGWQAGRHSMNMKSPCTCPPPPPPPPTHTHCNTISKVRKFISWSMRQAHTTTVCFSIDKLGHAPVTWYSAIYDCHDYEGCGTTAPGFTLHYEKYPSTRTSPKAHSRGRIRSRVATVDRNE